MSEELPESLTQICQVNRQKSELTKLSTNGSPALKEIISRSLIHIQTSKALSVRHKVGEHELCGPDYQLVCVWAEELRLTSEEVLYRLMDRSETTTVITPGGGMILTHSIENSVLDDFRENYYTTLVNGSFKRMLVIRKDMPITGIPSIQGLVIQNIRLHEGICYEGNKDFDLDLNSVPDLVELYSRSFQIKNFDLSAVPKLKKLECSWGNLVDLELSGVPFLAELDCRGNSLAQLDLSPIPNLSVLVCDRNQLLELDLSPVPNLSILVCSHNQLRELDLSFVPNLTKLICEDNPIAELDIRCLKHLQSLNEFGFKDCIHSDKIRLIKRKDQ